MPDERVRSVPRIAVGGILTECNHLGGVPIDLAVYETSGLYRGVELFKLQTSVVGGMLRELQDASTDIIPLIFASACAGGPISADCYAQLRGEWHQRLRDACPVDGVLLPLHGSALADGNDDPEGDLIHAARLLVEPDIPIIAGPYRSMTPIGVSENGNSFSSKRLRRSGCAKIAAHCFEEGPFRGAFCSQSEPMRWNGLNGHCS